MDYDKQQRAVRIISTAVSVVGAVFLGGGFYYGLNKQKKALAEEENLDKSLTRKKPIKLERKRWEKAVNPTTAAWKALVGVTLVSVTGCCLVMGVAAATLGVGNINELCEKLKKSQNSKKTITFQEFHVQEVKQNLLEVIEKDIKENNASNAHK